MSIEESRKLSKLYIDMYEGEGKDNPPIVTRLDRVERATASVNKLTWAVILGGVAAIIDVLVSKFH